VQKYEFIIDNDVIILMILLPLLPNICISRAKEEYRPLLFSYFFCRINKIKILSLHPLSGFNLI